MINADVIVGNADVSGLLWSVSRGHAVHGTVVDPSDRGIEGVEVVAVMEVDSARRYTAPRERRNACRWVVRGYRTGRGWLSNSCLGPRRNTPNRALWTWRSTDKTGSVSGFSLTSYPLG